MDKLEVDIENFKEEAKILEKFIEMKKDENWKNVRKAEGNFELIELNFPFGKRKAYKPIVEEKNYNLQASRGIGINDDTDMQKIIDEVAIHLSIQESDTVRIDELDFVFKEIDRVPMNDPNYDLIKNYVSRKNQGICEIGFRTHKLMKYYQDRGHKKAIGYDINNFNVSISQKLGYDCRFYDLNDLEKELDLSDISLLLSYHTLEHCTDPYSALEKIYNSCEPGTLFHVEVPIEPDGPRLQFGHLFAFYENDLVAMLNLVGFEIISMSRVTHQGGPHVERCTAVKK